ncbi:ABC transporter permease [Salipiger mucosus]|uniref:Dipeptide transport system permease protein DppC n=1 Tax=Salipiger mucosus DSM 16094 TaxID=1123237 RepID=S9S2C2_9RHOB|nr:ABC transporter permease [Salipiger mucosus]EPX80359.1 Dipeptide transport system permease protein DppC [Salipiger mucosus DSM 16094]
MTDLNSADLGGFDDTAVPAVSSRRRAMRRFARNRAALVGLAIFALILLVALLAPLLSPFPGDVADEVHFDRLLQPPSATYLMGTDEAGRDVLTRVMHGAKLSLVMGISVIAIAASVGVPLGLAAGYYGGWTEIVIMRITDVFSSIPALVLALAISVVLGASLLNVVIALSVVWWRVFCRIAHGQTLSIKQENFVTAAQSMGASDAHVMFREILPNMASSLLVAASLDAGIVILTGTAISFLGAGANPPTAEWGLMVATGRHYLPDAWWASLFPGIAIFLTVMSLNMIGDGLRDFFAEE